MSRDVVFHAGRVGREQRERLLGQRGCVVWLTGLSGSGKSTIASALEERLIAAGKLAFVLDGDNLRHGLNADLGFSAEDRQENIRRAGEVAALLAEAGVLVVTAFISPYIRDRERARETVGRERFLEVFVDTPIAVCEERDPKGLYVKARAGAIPEFTGVSAPYEPPVDADVVVDTTALTVESSVDALFDALERRGILRA